MPTLVTTFNWGSAVRNDNPELNRQISQAYTQTAQVVNTKISKYTTNGEQRPNVDPPASSQFNQSFEIGDVYVRTDTDMAWMMTSRINATDVVWTLIT